jgi:hypothetical protein
MLQDLVRLNLEALQADERDAATAADRLTDVPREEWLDRISADPALRTVGALGYLLNHAQDLLDDDAGAARALTAVLVQLVPSSTNGRLIALRGRALRLHSHALRIAGEGEQARTTLQAALTLLALHPAGGIELAHAWLLAAYMSHEAGDPDAAVAYLQKAAHGFAARANARGLLHARQFEAAILFERHQEERAARLYAEALPVAELLGDERSRARIVANLGQCARHLNHDALAFTYFAQAAPLYHALHMRAEAQGILWAFAAIARKHGRLEEALHLFRAARDAFLARNMLLPASSVGLDMLDLLVMHERPDLAVSLAAELVAVFRRAGMPLDAMRAFNALNAIAQRRRVAGPHVAAARQRLNRVLERAA